MNPFWMLAVFGASVAPGIEATTTTPVGYESQTLQPGLSLDGLRMHHNRVTDGVIKELGADSLEIGYSTEGSGGLEEELSKMQKGKTYLLEFRRGVQEGALQEITRWEGDGFRCWKM